MPFVYFRPSKAVKASVREHVRLEQYLAYVIGLLDFQEFLFRAFVRICVRMILSSKLFVQKRDSKYVLYTHKNNYLRKNKPS